MIGIDDDPDGDRRHFHGTLQPIYDRRQDIGEQAFRMFLDAKVFKERLEELSRIAAAQTSMYAEMAASLQNVKVKLSTGLHS